MIRKLFFQIIRITLIITVIVGTIISFFGGRFFLTNYIFTLSYSFFITAIANILIHILNNRFDVKFKILYYLLLILILSVSALIGTLLGSFVLSLFYTNFFFSRVTLYIIVFNLIMAFLFGSLSVIIFKLYQKYETSRLALQKKEIEALKLEKEKTQAELRALQSQTNPHFLFNVLNSIASLILINPERAREMVEVLSEYYQIKLRVSNSLFVKVASEIKLVSNYLFLEKIRFGDRLKYSIDVDSRLDDFRIPSFIIQPLVENAIKHGISRRVEGGNVRVQVDFEDKETVRIIVADDGRGFSFSGVNKGYGLSNILNKISLIYGEKAEFKVHNNKESVVEMKIPYDYTPYYELEGGTENESPDR